MVGKAGGTNFASGPLHGSTWANGSPSIEEDISTLSSRFSEELRQGGIPTPKVGATLGGRKLVQQARSPNRPSPAYLGRTFVQNHLAAERKPP
jgi:hypothetical protein